MNLGKGTMPSNGKLFSDYSPEEWERLRKSIVNPSAGYWIAIIVLAALLLLAGLFRLGTEGFTYEAILFTGAGIVLLLLLATNIFYRLSRSRRK